MSRVTNLFARLLMAECKGTPLAVWVLVFCPIVLSLASLIGVPACAAWRHGTPWNGNFIVSGVDKHGRSFTDTYPPVGEIVTAYVSILLVFVPLFISALALVLSRFGREQYDTK